ESDLIKLGKKMQTCINKLILQRVANPEVVKKDEYIRRSYHIIIKIYILNHVATAFKIDLKYNCQYRMMKI
ncbi:hypothetical protein BD408DRAFT_328923, partial [Parasitella parasitica]